MKIKSSTFCLCLFLLFGLIANAQYTRWDSTSMFQPRFFASALFSFPVSPKWSLSTTFIPALNIGYQFSPEFELMGEFSYSIQLRERPMKGNYIPDYDYDYRDRIDLSDHNEFRLSVFPTLRLPLFNRSSILLMMGLGYQAVIISNLPTWWIAEDRPNISLKMLGNQVMTDHNFIIHPRIAYEYLARSERRQKLPTQKIGIALSVMFTPYDNFIALNNADMQVNFGSTAQRQKVNISNAFDLTVICLEFYIGGFGRVRRR